jgi:glycosyltransferase involved in cell wall biosynthesis
MTPNFSICLIGRNEEKMLHRLISTLVDFQMLGGEVVLVDTGSIDGTAEMARAAGFKVEEVGSKFLVDIDKEKAGAINAKFMVGGEKNVVESGDKVFDFSSARNYAASLAKNNHVSFADCDEAFTVMDINKINELISSGNDQFEYNFVFSHDDKGNEAIKFVQSKFYNRTKLKWVNMIHEVLAPITNGPIQKAFLPETIFKLEHWQNQETNRTGYLKGLALDCFNNQGNDRNSHYFARECFYHGRYRTAIKEFERHIGMNGWTAERAQSMIFMGDCYGFLNEPELQEELYSKAIFVDSNRREAYVKLAQFYLHNKNYRAAIAYASAALTIPWDGYYANNKELYENIPHEILYVSYGWIGDIKNAKENISKALEYRPLNSVYLRDLRYYFKLPTVSIVIPTINTRPDGMDKLIESIYKLNYPKELVSTIVEEGAGTVPEKTNKGVDKSQADYIVFAADDMEFTPDALILAVWDSIRTGKRLVAFDTGVRNAEGYICEHFLIKKDLIQLLDKKEVFCSEVKHVGCDDFLWKQCEKLGEAMISSGYVLHKHFSRPGGKMDETNVLGWSNEANDRAIIKRKIEELNR